MTQGDPCGIGPETLLRTFADVEEAAHFRPILVAERCALEALRDVVQIPWDRLVYLDAVPTRTELEALEGVAVLDPVREPRTIAFGSPGAEDARATLACIDSAVALARSGLADAVVTAPINKAVIAEHVASDFRGHTDYLAELSGDLAYGRDYLMAFYSDDLKVALLSTHEPLLQALGAITTESVLDALRCLAPFARGTIALAGFNPHAGEGGLMGEEDDVLLVPAVSRAREEGIDVVGPVSADSLFFRARQGEYDWVLALYHDQGLIAVKTISFGDAANVTLGLPFLRTSVDHGTAYDLAGTGRASAGPMKTVVAKTLALLADLDLDD